MAPDSPYEEVVAANIALHSRMANDYNSCEPHFRPENVELVEAKLTSLFDSAGRRRLLDLGCGTGFIINIAKKHVDRITGVDVTQAMLDKVDRSGSSEITLLRGDTGSVDLEEGEYDVVSAYSFLHHLFEIGPTLRTAFRALRAGGRFWADLEPNYYFWKSIGEVSEEASLDPIVAREVEAVTRKDEDIQRTFGVPKEVFNRAEFGKNVAGGFREEELRGQLLETGFRDVQINYGWFLGQGALINDQRLSADERRQRVAIIDGWLRRSMPVARNLFKYVGFTATK